jgi:Ca2+-binding RTX toxin-like protein
MKEITTIDGLNSEVEIKAPIQEPLDTIKPIIIPDPLPPTPPVPEPIVINGDDQNNVISTTVRNDLVNAFAGDDFIKGSQGNDVINGGAGFDTMSYARLNGPIRLGPGGTVDKGALGVDQLNSVEKIIGSNRRGDVIDTSTATGTARMDIDLSANRAAVLDVPGIPGGLSFVVENFEDAIGTQNNDRIIGDKYNNSISGGAGDDIIAGTNGVGTSPGLGERDVLTGGGGNDKFLLGSGTNLYYNGKGNADFAKITDFADGGDQIFLANGKYALNADETALFAVNVGADGTETRDLIAKIAYTALQGDIYRKSGDDSIVDPESATKTFSLAEGQSFGKFTSTLV